MFEVVDVNKLTKARSGTTSGIFGGLSYNGVPIQLVQLIDDKEGCIVNQS